MAYVVTTGQLGVQAIAETSTTKNHSLGKTVKAKDPTYGEGEFIYLLGAANTVVGSLVTYNATTYQTVLEPGSADDTGAPLAVAMSANVAGQYGWYQMEGLAVIKKVAVAFSPQVALFVSGTAGRVTSVSSAGEQVVGARSANLASVTSTTSTITALINRPSRTGI